MPPLAHATTVTFLEPDPNGPIHEYASFRCTPTLPNPKQVVIEVPIDAHPLDDNGLSQAPSITPGWEALISDSAGAILVDGHVVAVTHGVAASVYTIAFISCLV